MKKCYHLSLDSRRRLIRLRDVVLNLLDEDMKFGFSECDLSYRIGPFLHSVLSLVWCKPLRGVSRPFCPANFEDKSSFVYVRLDVYERMEMELVRLSEENNRLLSNNRVLSKAVCGSLSFQDKFDDKSDDFHDLPF